MKKIFSFLAANVLIIAGFLYAKVQDSVILLWEANVEALANAEEDAEKELKIWFVEEHFNGAAITCTKGGDKPCK